MHFATNFLGHFLLTNLLHPLLAPSARIINITSGGYMVTPFRFSDYNFCQPTSSLPLSERPNEATVEMLGIPDFLSTKESYVPLIAYLHSNTANVLFSTALAEKGIQAFSAAPGVVVTDCRDICRRDFAIRLCFISRLVKALRRFWSRRWIRR
jgi:NAD(P)-dependent dehydrogenase (short-subunit alcohol dehydrogenase family)